MNSARISQVLAAAACQIAVQAAFAAEEPVAPVDFEGPEHAYFESTPRDSFTTIIPSIERNLLGLDVSNETEYLGGLLKALNIPESSQVLVYSATSLQLAFISLGQPRAIYFNDDVYVGHVRGGRIEVISIDPNLGAIFSIFDIPRSKGQATVVERSGRCMNCHANDSTGKVPGVVIKSVIPGPNNGALDSFRRDQLGHQVPLAERFGGWHVTGADAFEAHRGNQTGRYVDGKIVTSPAKVGDFADLSVYLRSTSDILPLLVMEHQAAFSNKLTELVYRWREARGSAAERVLNQQIDAFVRYALFADEAKLPSGGFVGDADFRRDFAAAGRKDSQGRSLRDFDLKTRLFRYRCSYMIDSAHFRGIPAPLRERIFARMRQALDPATPDPEYAYLPPGEKAAIIEILRATMFAKPANG
jgi:hypothetical protein